MSAKQDGRVDCGDVIGENAIVLVLHRLDQWLSNGVPRSFI
jgi:hypothetical protein